MCPSGIPAQPNGAGIPGLIRICRALPSVFPQLLFQIHYALP